MAKFFYSYLSKMGACQQWRSNIFLRSYDRCSLVVGSTMHSVYFCNYLFNSIYEEIYDSKRIFLK